MKYKYVSDLPENIQNVLPKHAQEIYMKAFNDSFEEDKDPDKRLPGESLQHISNEHAWEAVKKEYRRDEKGKWVKKQL
ncbi:MAG: ChaB family protein [Parachlamydiales bacterium]|nr:ChaB family protein [Parachlamydiales bacterium]